MWICPGIQFLGDKPEFLLVQVKTTQCPKAIREQIRAFRVPEGVIKQIVIYRNYSRQGPRIEVIP